MSSQGYDNIDSNNTFLDTYNGREVIKWARKVFWDTVKGLASKGKTIIFSTHYLQEAHDVADRIILFNKGKIIADGKPEEIKGLTKMFKYNKAVDDISFSIKSGEIVSILGPNIR